MNRRRTETIAERLAAHVVDLTWADMSTSALHAGRKCILDSIGAAIGAARREAGAPVRALFADEQPGSGGHRIFGSHERRSGQAAAWANGFLMHVEDFDDSPHTSYFLPALLVAAAHKPTSGREFLLGWLAAYQTWMVLIDALRIDRPFNPTSIVAPIAAAAGAARIRGLSLSATARALAIATQASGGIRGHFGTDMKALDSARSAAGGAESVRMADAGWTAELGIFDAHNGWISAFGGAGRDPARAHAVLDEPWSAFPVTGRPPLLKSVPCCARHIGPLAALERILPAVGSGDVTSVRAELGFDPASTAAFRSVPRTPMEARFSLPFVLASACIDGAVSVESFSRSSFDRTMASHVFASVALIFEPDRAGSMDTETCAVELLLRDGRVLRAEQRGLPSLTDGALAAKFDENVGASGEVAALWREALAHLDDVDDVNGLFDVVWAGTLADHAGPSGRDTSPKGTQ